MTDELFGDEGEFDEGFFASLAANPDDPVDYGADSGLDGPLGEDGEFLYEAEGDGSFETDTAGFDADDEAFASEFEPDFDPGLEPDFDPDHDFDHGYDQEFGPDLDPGL